MKEMEDMFIAQSKFDSEESFEPSRFTDAQIIGQGSFGVVYSAKLRSTNEVVAIKKVCQVLCFGLTLTTQVPQDKRYKNRELDIMKELSHQNVVKLRDYLYLDDGMVRDACWRSDNESAFLNRIATSTSSWTTCRRTFIA